MRLIFAIPGEPAGKGRPKFGNGRTYTPKKTENYEAYVKMLCVEAMLKQGWKIRQAEALSMTVTAYFRPPQSASKTKREDMLKGLIRPTKRPDFDNIGKIVADALNGIAYRDDAQIVDARQIKLYGDIPRVEVEIAEV
jgi:Holliday junction resolvase RusA-like endonuclease